MPSIKLQLDLKVPTRRCWLHLNRNGLWEAGDFPVPVFIFTDWSMWGWEPPPRKKRPQFSLLGIQRVIEYFSEILGWVWERAWGRPNTGGVWVPPLESNLLRGKNLSGRWGRSTNMAQDEEENWSYYSTWLLTCLFQPPRHMDIPKNKCLCMNMNKSLIPGAQATLLWVTSGRVRHREEGVIYLPEVRGANQGPGRPGTEETVSSWVRAAEGKGAAQVSTAAKEEHLCVSTFRKTSGWGMSCINFVAALQEERQDCGWRAWEWQQRWLALLPTGERRRVETGEWTTTEVTTEPCEAVAKKGVRAEAWAVMPEAWFTCSEFYWGKRNLNGYSWNPVTLHVEVIKLGIYTLVPFHWPYRLMSRCLDDPHTTSWLMFKISTNPSDMGINQEEQTPATGLEQGYGGPLLSHV